MIQDLQFALRGWKRTPEFAIAAIGTLALGIGANTAIFSVVSGVLLRPLPFAHPEQLVRVSERQPPSPSGVGFEGGVVYRDFQEWRADSKLLDQLVTYFVTGRNLTGIGEPEQVRIGMTERHLFGFLGV